MIRLRTNKIDTTIEYRLIETCIIIEEGSSKISKVVKVRIRKVCISYELRSHKMDIFIKFTFV